MKKNNKLKNKLILSTTIASLSLFGYGRRTYAACVVSSFPTVLCSGSNYLGQSIPVNNANVITTAGFRVSSNVTAITITGDGPLSFNDAYASTIRSYSAQGLRINATGNYYSDEGSITINVDSSIVSRDSAIFARNTGLGAIDITSNGLVSSSTYYGIYSSNANAYGTGDLIITTGVDSYINSYSYAIVASNNSYGSINVTVEGDIYSYRSGIVANNANVYGTGDLTISTGADSFINATSGILARNTSSLGTIDITVNGDVSARSNYAISARNSNAYGTGDLIITTGADSYIYSYYRGIIASNNSYGSIDITANGDIVGNNSAIYVSNVSGTGDLTITTGADSIITGNGNIIYAGSSSYSGSIDITINGDITGSANFGIAAYNLNANGTGDLTITTGADSIITTNYVGISAINNSYGLIDITVNGDVASTTFTGIRAYNFNAYGTGDLTISTGADSIITGGVRGIHAVNNGVGAIDITVNGDVIGTSGAGILASNISPGISYIKLNSGSNVSGAIGINISADSQADVTLDGTSSAVTVTGTGGTAIQFGNLADNLTISGDVSITGDVIGGSGTDIINLIDTTVTLGIDSVIGNFEMINLTGTNIVNGDIDANGLSIIQSTGSNLNVNGDFTADAFTVSSGSEFGGNNTFSGNFIIASGGTLAPGNSIGAINVVGDLTFNTGSTFEVEVSGATSDSVTATGNVVIESGVTLEVVPLTSFSGTSTTFLTGATLTGTFDIINYNGVETTVIYDATTASFGSGGGVTILAANPSSLNAQAAALTQISTLFGDIISDEAIFKRGKNYWAKTIYSNKNRQTDSKYAGFNSNIYGGTFGAQYNISDNLDVGYAVGDLFNNTNVKLSADSSRSNSILTSIYGTYNKPLKKFDMFTNIGLIGGYIDTNNKRAVDNSGIISMAKSDNTSYQTGAFMQVGAKAPIKSDWSVMPKVGVSYYHTDTNGLTEQNAGIAGISVDDYGFDTLKTSQTIYLYNDKGVSVYDNIKVKLKFDIGLSQEYAANSRDVTGSFSNGSPLTLQLDQSSSNFINTGISAGIDFSDSLSGAFNYRSSFNSDETRNDFRLQVIKRF
jgi:hypothetical protein